MDKKYKIVIKRNENWNELDNRWIGTIYLNEKSIKNFRRITKFGLKLAIRHWVKNSKKVEEYYL